MSAADLPRKSFYRQSHIWIILLVLVIAFLLFRYWEMRPSRDRHPQTAIPVVIALAQTKNVPVYLSALGSVTPTDSVTVKTQINGQLLRVLFREGQTVKKGDLLAEIDPRPLEAQLMQYEGQLARDKALLANAHVDLKRYTTLWREDSVAKQTLDTQRALIKQYEGTVKLDEGLIEGVRVNLIYTRIISPINGRVGLRLVDPGNYVQVSDPNGIVTINTLDPITVVFSLPEDNIPQIMQQINAGKTLPVLAYNREQSKLLATGSLLTIDNQIDPTTGTVKLKALFKNPENQLFPNQFVNIQLHINTLQNAIVVPTAAIQHGSQGTFVYLVNANNTVSVKNIKSGVSYNGFTAVTSGLNSGQAVVVEGADKLADGVLVTTAVSGMNDKLSAKKSNNKNKYS